jgi:hypothetical protein
MTDKDSGKRSLGERINTWVQIVGILVAAGWGVYTFVYKEIELPSLVPVNLEISNPVIMTSSANNGLCAVQIRFAAKNPSSREVHLLPGIWVAFGTHVKAAATDDAAFEKDASAILKDPRIINAVQRHVQLQSGSMVAMGNLFGDITLKPWGETAGYSILFYIPASDYDEIAVMACIVSAANVSGVQLDWSSADIDRWQVWSPRVYRVNKNGKRTIIPTDENGNYTDKRFGVKETYAMARF